MNGFVAPPVGGQLDVLAPYLVVAVGGLAIMLVDALLRTRRRDHLSFLTLLVLLGSVLAQLAGGAGDEREVLAGMMTVGDFARFFNLLFAGCGVLTTVFAGAALERGERGRPEFYPLLLFSILGMMVLAAASDLLTVFLGIETMSLAVYVLAGGVRGNVRSSEAGFKYLLLGGFASAFLLLGMALLYGFAGGTAFSDVAAALAQRDGDLRLAMLGGGLVLVGLGFKVALVPFHMWTPDVYDGAPAYVTGFMATAVKAAGFAILIRFAWLMQPQLAFVWYPVLAGLAVLTMSVGNLVALAQNNVKRLLAWSSIAHAGYLMLGVVTLISPATGGSAQMVLGREVGESAGSALLFYLLAYSLMNLAAFGVVSSLGSREGDADDIERYAGLSRRRPVAAAVLAVAMLSLAGIPPLVGFMSKFYLFSAVVRADLVPLAVIGVINSLVSVYYYLRLLVVMYMKQPEGEVYDGHEPLTVGAAAVLAGLVLLLGVMPDAVHRAALVVFRQISF
ncbi:NADH-quinone oxidoreductase subunit N [bacterium]|nr:NADH-quinone oxidoreductase subunit N [bacterium]